MTLFQLILLAIIQGLTEFIPVSSSGHLFLFFKLTETNSENTQISNVILFLHIGTLLSLLIHYRSKLFAYLKSLINYWGGKNNKQTTKDIQMINRIVIATIPATIAGFLLMDTLDNFYSQEGSLPVIVTSLALIIVGFIFILLEKFYKKKKGHKPEIGYKDALFIGCLQIFALFFGVSRSGTTISGGLYRNLKRIDALEFSFLMSIPIIFGGILLKAYEVWMEKSLTSDEIELYLLGIVISCLVGLGAIKFLLKYLSQKTLVNFGIYRIIFGILCLVILLN